MTVAELIAELSKLPPGMKVRVDGYGFATGVVSGETFYGEDVVYVEAEEGYYDEQPL